MKISFIKWFMIIFIQLIAIQIKLFAATKCQIQNSQGGTVFKLNDLFFKALSNQAQCPQNIDELSFILEQKYQNQKFLVANRGRNNPRLGSFSFFESYSEIQKGIQNAGIFLGHFTRLEQNNNHPTIGLDQLPIKGKLIIELIAWDDDKGYYNFYELIGQGAVAQWFYRGDSKDILLDNQGIYLTEPTQFGSRLRCSGCHVSGGPIMKELDFPHNDWWTKSRPLVFNQIPSSSMMDRMKKISSAENFSEQIKNGIQRLEKSLKYQNLKNSFTVQNQLRPLFCDMEINIQSDRVPLEQSTMIQIPMTSLGGVYVGKGTFSFSKNNYLSLLQQFKMQFPETQSIDSDHAWLAPIKGYADWMAIQSLKLNKLINDKDIYDIHFSAPIGAIMNKERCQLLKLVPNIRNWKPIFLQNLKFIKSDVAMAMYQRMTNSQFTVAAYKERIKQWQLNTAKKLQNGEAESLFVQLLSNRKSILESEISKNPKGQILEPGFRVIFPISHTF